MSHLHHGSQCIQSGAFGFQRIRTSRKHCVLTEILFGDEFQHALSNMVRRYIHPFAWFWYYNLDSSLCIPNLALFQSLSFLNSNTTKSQCI